MAVEVVHMLHEGINMLLRPMWSLCSTNFNVKKINMKHVNLRAKLYVIIMWIAYGFCESIFFSGED